MMRQTTIALEDGNVVTVAAMDNAGRAFTQATFSQPEADSTQAVMLHLCRHLVIDGRPPEALSVETPPDVRYQIVGDHMEAMEACIRSGLTPTTVPKEEKTGDISKAHPPSPLSESFGSRLSRHHTMGNTGHTPMNPWKNR